MLLGTDPLDTLEVPDETTIEEHDLVTDGNAVVGGQNAVEFSVHGRSVLTGERVTSGGNIEAEADCRLNMLDDVADNVPIGNDAHLGECVYTAGRLMVSGDFDIGDDVDIEERSETDGWIVIHNPIPALVLYSIALSQFLRLGEDETADELAKTLADGLPHDPFVTPRDATVSDDAWRVPTPVYVGSDCRIHGNIRAKSIDLVEDNNVSGSLRAHDDIVVGSETRIHGDVTARDGEARIHENACVLGDVSYNDLVLEVDTHIDGTTRVRSETHTHRDNLPREAE